MRHSDSETGSFSPIRLGWPRSARSCVLHPRDTKGWARGGSQVAAGAQLPHVEEKASGRKEATEKLRWPPAFSQAVCWGRASPARKRRLPVASSQGSVESRIMEFVVLEGTLVPGLTHVSKSPAQLLRVSHTEPRADIVQHPSVLSPLSLQPTDLGSC